MKTQIRQLEKQVDVYTLKPGGKIFIGLKNKKNWIKYVIPIKKQKKENVSERIDQLLYGEKR